MAAASGSWFETAAYLRARQVAPQWLNRFYGGRLDEWHYRGTQRSIIVEPFIGTAKAAGRN